MITATAFERHAAAAHPGRFDWRRALVYGLLWGVAITMMETSVLPLDIRSPVEWLGFGLDLLMKWTLTGVALASATMLLTVNVSNVNDAPSFAANPLSAPSATEAMPYGATLAGSATDPDLGDSLVFTMIDGPAWLQVASGGTLSGTPSTADLGENSFTVRVTDTDGLVAETTVKVSVGRSNGTWANVLGGSWGDATYRAASGDAVPLFDRSRANGFRCVKYVGAEGPPEALAAPIERRFRDYSKEKPVSDEVFEVYKALYHYDKSELNPVVEAVDTSSDLWRREKVSFNAGYGNERVIAHLFLPKATTGPYQTVIYFPGATAQ